ncbi:P-loop containing nucleoside triphosphate hydrolase protein, partial [Ochromonadaceae sp. CCMP2298]
MVVICNESYEIHGNGVENQVYFDQFDFPLSDFQKYAIEAIVKKQHVLITAHTGSGKTLPAEFAIDYLVKKGKKLIYTCPIKALSNQKFYDFSKKFPHITFGLFTGDIKTNPGADVLIMTTEILMNTLFAKGSASDQAPRLQFDMDFENELAAVVFDEIHYINDADRGQVWEKTILMLPSHVQMIMLSATIDNPVRFARWCEQQKGSNKQVYLSSTNHRVVPLTHYSFLAAGESTLKQIKDKQMQQYIRNKCNNIQCIQTKDGEFQEDTYRDLMKTTDWLLSNKVFSKRKSVLNDLTSFLRDNDMLPAIGFVFSRKQVEQCARDITTTLLEDDNKQPYTIQRECDQILRRLPNHLEYSQLPEYIELVSFLEKGVGIHHSGMIPILREMVELCISKNYIKVLFATESFAIGLDCPIKTAIFLSVKKFDGNGERDLHPHEYTQMAGRAGRRGIDNVGYVV